MAMAIACLREVTFGPCFDPECSVPVLYSCITFSTFALLPALVVGFFRGISTPAPSASAWASASASSVLQTCVDAGRPLSLLDQYQDPGRVASEAVESRRASRSGRSNWPCWTRLALLAGGDVHGHRFRRRSRFLAERDGGDHEAGRPGYCQRGAH